MTKWTSQHLAMLGILAVGLIGCGEPAGRVNIDLRGLAAQAGALNMPLDQVRLRVLPDQTVPTERDMQQVAVPVSDMQFELEVPAGRWLFEAIGERHNVDPAVPTYFGDQRIEIEPLDDRDLLIPMFPAGLLEVEVLIPESVQLSDALIRFVPDESRPDQSTSYTALFSAGKLNRVLPTGSYGVRGEVTFDGTNYKSAGPEITVTIAHGVRQLEVFEVED